MIIDLALDPFFAHARKRYGEKFGIAFNLHLNRYLSSGLIAITGIEHGRETKQILHFNSEEFDTPPHLDTEPVSRPGGPVKLHRHACLAMALLHRQMQQVIQEHDLTALHVATSPLNDAGQAKDIFDSLQNLSPPIPDLLNAWCREKPHGTGLADKDLDISLNLLRQPDTSWNAFSFIWTQPSCSENFGYCIDRTDLNSTLSEVSERWGEKNIHENIVNFSFGFRRGHYGNEGSPSKSLMLG